MPGGDHWHMIRILLFLFMGLLCLTSLCIEAEDEPSLSVYGETISLPPPDMAGFLSLEESIEARRSIRSYANVPLSSADLSALLWAAQGITDDTRGFRAAPSAGAMYPLEVTVAIGDAKGIAPGSYRYIPEGHELQKINDGDHREALATAALGQQMPADAPVTIVISGVYERTAIRYGDRAERYTWMEAGHASQNCYLIATARGLGTVAIGAFDEKAVQEIMGLPEDEIPLYLMPVGKRE